jgi:hypothetical protein
MGVVLCRLQGSIAGQRAQDQQPGVCIHHRGKQVWLLQAWRRLRTAGLAGVPARP